jgi:RNA polymerase sigma-70 factor (ECF subfamily)
VKDTADRRRLKRVAKGDSAALAELFDEHASLLAMRLRHNGASIEETEDVLQETFLDVWKAASTFRRESAVAGWLWGIASRKYRMLVRGEVRLRHRQARARKLAEDVNEEDSWALSVTTQAALNHLNEELRAAFVAVAIDGMTTAEAAQILRIPEGTVKSRVHRARQTLKKELQ